ncbi:hypothetical protein I4F81_009328 [Pyropia yezoensis]|uniref:Uncharacterized protein n=1 Tax=Pyropia yezoensis TaxID=2788 RepID=A0ACC3CA12_PYRYE|nr:hypothetical protein I4F81_009328 [Neopyropia yezoensis]
MTSRVGDYLLFDTLGQGSFAKVKLAVHEGSGEECAIKVMDKSKIHASAMTLHVRREIAIMKTLKHPYVIRLHAVLNSSSKLYLVMDLVKGGELFHKIVREGYLSEAEGRKHFQQLVDGVSYCHSMDVCHRDLKSDGEEEDVELVQTDGLELLDEVPAEEADGDTPNGFDRPGSAADSRLSLLQVARVLSQRLGYPVLVNRSENKVKCAVQIAEQTVMLSILATQSDGQSTVVRRGHVHHVGLALS